MSRPSALPPLAAEVRQIRALLPQENASARPDAQERNIQVLCRFRGQSEVEAKRCGKAAWDLQNASQGTVSDVGSTGSLDFSYDRVYGPEAKQSDIYDAIVPVVNEVLNGVNGAVLCYGQTSAGKTFTMEGVIDQDDDSRGVIPRSLATLFSEAGRIGNVRLHVSMLEIYMERLRDLLNPEGGVELRIIEDRQRGVVVPGLSEFVVADFEQALEVFRSGQLHRAVATTGMNDRSSRSHSIFIIKAERNDGIRTSFGKLCLVDLAGSECLKKACLRGRDAAAANAEIVEESKAINQSLSTLSMVISRLAERRRHRYEPHVPYRSSKLTHVLKDVIGGSSQTVLVINCSIASLQVPETISTLRFGSRARSVVNSLPSGQHGEESLLLQTLRAARCEIERLRAIAATGADPTTGSPNADPSGFEDDLPSPIGHQSCSRRTLLHEFESRSPSPACRSPLSLAPSARPSAIGPTLAASRRASRSAAVSAAQSRRVSTAYTEAPLSPLSLSPSRSGAASRRVSQSRRPSVLATALSNTLEFSPSMAETQQQVEAMQGIGLSTVPPSPSALRHNVPKFYPWEFPMAKKETSRRVIMIAEMEVEKLQIDLDEQRAQYMARLEELRQHCAALQAENEWLTADRMQHLEHAVRSSFEDSRYEDPEDVLSTPSGSASAVRRGTTEPAPEPDSVSRQNTEVERLQALQEENASLKQAVQLTEDLASKRLTRERQASAQASKLSEELAELRRQHSVQKAAAATPVEAEDKSAQLMEELKELRAQQSTNAAVCAEAERKNSSLVEALEDMRRQRSVDAAAAALAAEAEGRALHLAEQLELLQSQNSTLTAAATSMTEQTHDLQTQLAAFEIKAAAAVHAEAKVAQLHEEVDSLQFQCAAHARNAAALPEAERAKAALLEELEGMRRQESIHTQSAASAAEQLLNLTKELEELRLHNSTLIAETASAAEHARDLDRQLSEQETKAAGLAEAQANASRLEEELVDLRHLHAAHLQTAAVATEEQKELRRELSENAALVAFAESKITRLHEAEAQVARLTEQYNDLSEKESARAASAALIAKELSDLREQQTEHEKAVAAAEQARARAATLAHELEDLRAEHSASTMSAAALTDELHSTRAAAASAAAAEAFAAQLSAELEDVRAQYLISTEAAANAAEEQARAAQVAAELEDLRSQYSNQAAAVVTAAQAKGEAEAKVTQLTEQLAYAAAAQATLETDSVAEIATKEARSQQLAAELAELRGQHLAQEAAAAAACHAKDEAEGQVTVLTEQLAARRRRSLDARSAVEIEQARSAQFAAELEQLRMQYSHQVETADAAMEELEELRLQYSNRAKEANTATHELEELHVHYSDRVQAADIATDELENLRAQYSRQEDSAAAAHQAKLEAEGQVAILSEELAARRRRSLATNQAKLEAEGQVVILSEELAARRRRSLAMKETLVESSSSDCTTPQELTASLEQQKAETTRLQAALANTNSLLAIQADRASKAEAIAEAQLKRAQIEASARKEVEEAVADRTLELAKLRGECAALRQGNGTPSPEDALIHPEAQPPVTGLLATARAHGATVKGRLVLALLLILLAVTISSTFSGNRASVPDWTRPQFEEHLAQATMPESVLGSADDQADENGIISGLWASTVGSLLSMYCLRWATR